MRYPGPLVTGRFVARRKRFLCDVVLPDGTAVTSHLANTGAMTGCTAPDAPVRLWDSADPRRKLRWSVEQIQVGGEWICVNTARPNRVVEEAVRAGRIAELAGYDEVVREAPLGEGRVDLRLAGRAGDARPCHVEVKCVTLRDGDVLRFPDARTERGTRHLRALAAAAAAGDRAVLLLLAAREGGDRVAPAFAVDPEWASTLATARSAGVEVVAYRATPRSDRIDLDDPLRFDPSR